MINTEVELIEKSLGQVRLLSKQERQILKRLREKELQQRL